jgi:hypothetical protein
MPYRISGLTVPLFETLTGTVRNLVLDEVAISGHSGNTGAIACTANGAARIYNVGILSGSVGGSGDVGGLVGQLDGTARVVNCYSYATITGGSNVGGIVGNNNGATSAANNNTFNNVSPPFGASLHSSLFIATSFSPPLIAPTPKKPQAFSRRRDVAASARDGFAILHSSLFT